MEEYKSYIRTVSVLTLGLGGLFSFFSLASLVSFLLIVLEIREPVNETSPTGMVLSVLFSGSVGAGGLVSFFLRKKASGWNLARIFGGLLTLVGLALPFLLQGEKPGIPPVATLGALFLSLSGIWIFVVTNDSVIRAARDDSGGAS